MKTSCFISVIVLAQNARDGVRPFVLELHQALGQDFEQFEIVLIDDGTTDGTAAVADRLLAERDCLRYLRLARRHGHEIAIAAGLETAIGDVVCLCQAIADPVSDIVAVIHKAQADRQLVLGIDTGRQFRLYEKPFRKMFFVLSNRLFKLELIPNTTYLIALNRDLLNSINSIKDRFRYIKAFTSIAGQNPVLHAYRQLHDVEPEKDSFFSRAILGFDIITSNTIVPLKLLSLAGLVYFAVFLFMLLVRVPLSVLMPHSFSAIRIGGIMELVSNGFIGISVAILSEYMGRLLLETKDRPLYYIAGEKASSVLVYRQAEKTGVEFQ